MEAEPRIDDEPLTWHYGLMARWWAEFVVAPPDELDFYRRCIRRYGQPALDAACGVGRLLVPLAESGLDVDGVDISEDMVALCRAKASAAGVAPKLRIQALHSLELPRRYRTIFVCDSFGIGGQRHHDRAALRRFWHHLEPGGALVVNVDTPWSDDESWRSWQPEQSRHLLAPWPATGTRRTASDGSELELRTRVVGVDAVAQRLTREMRIGLWTDGDLVAEEERTLLENLYFPGELELLLEQAGFSEIAAYGGYGAGPPTAADGMVVFIGRR